MMTIFQGLWEIMLNLLTLRHFHKINECWDAQQTALSLTIIYHLFLTLLQLLNESFLTYFKRSVNKFDPKNGQVRSFAVDYLHPKQQTTHFPKYVVFIFSSITIVTCCALVEF